MKTTETITTQSGIRLQVETRTGREGLEVHIQTPIAKRCMLHWGLRHGVQREWRVPPRSVWPPGTRPFGQNAVQTPFSRQDGQAGVIIRLSPPSAYASLDFVLFFPDEGRWDNNEGRNYQVLLPTAEQAPSSVIDVLHELTGAEIMAFERIFEIEERGRLAVAVAKVERSYRVVLLSDIPGALILHWGIAQQSPHEWLLPPESMRGPDTTVWQDHTAQTRFGLHRGYNALRLELPESEAPLGIQFVLRHEQDGGRWINYRGGNFYVPVHVGLPKPTFLGAEQLAELADQIVRAEMARSSWTLMHRFNLCYELLDRVRNHADGLALLFVWLRFSAIRQLTWQRNYNTKPRELAHAQDRLTHKLAEMCRDEPGSRVIARLMLATVGRGGEGQRIRDEILNIMHRHHIKEVSGHFLEEWHQKLHNNTTPDDVVICEAYLEFLRSNGNLDRFYQTLQDGGVSRPRLETFERPIRSRPDFVPHLRDDLIRDFESFLRTLKAVHSGTDLETAINAAQNQIDSQLRGLLRHVWEHRNDPPAALVDLISKITEARRNLSQLLHRSDGLRELLYLDLALEQALRVAVERNLDSRLGADQLVVMIARVLENVTLAYEDAELAACSRHWERLQALPRFGAEWSLHAKSVIDRIGRALGAWIDHFYQLLQPKAEYLGRAFQAEQWTITLFSEEVVRGSSLGFVLSVLLHRLDPVLRKAARLGSWQIVSRGRGAGQVEVVDSLRSVQDTRFEGPTVIVADRVAGDEEIPEGVTAVIAPDVTDIVSHVAVRARNANLLFASCYDPEMIRHLKSLRGRHVSLEVNAAGDVVVKELVASPAPTRPRPRAVRPRFHLRWFTRYAVEAQDFNEKLVGGKSCGQAQLRGRLPQWVRQPPSVAVPFGVFEKVLGLHANREAARRYHEGVGRAEGGDARALAELREAVLSLTAPSDLEPALHAAMNRAGMTWPEDWEATWNCIKRVWASKWNERAVLSRRKMGLAHQDLFMAVLIQPVVEAEYAFVIHTVNPASDNRDELYAEVVLGLGETLVGNYPGRALGFVWHKQLQSLSMLSFPNKSIALYGGGLIFRSDSSGEDLAGYAGAGLYDSVLLPPPRAVLLDYSQEALVWEEGYRSKIMSTVAQLGVAVESLLGAAQDIEGVIAHGEYHLVQTRPQVGIEHA
jgi:alpha-glucan,water dikinase